MSDSGQEESKSRRRRNDYDRDSKDRHSRRRSYSDEAEEPQSRRRDRHDRERSYRDRSRSQDRSRQNRRSRSPPSKRRRQSQDEPSSGNNVARRSRGPLPSQTDQFQDTQIATNPDAPPPVQKEKPNYKPTGLLAKEANTIAGTTTVLKYHEPPEARKPPPSQAWRLYVFGAGGGKDVEDTIYLSTRSAWLFGRDEKVADYALQDRGCSKQHAVVQFRFVEKRDDFGEKKGRVKPYLIDLESKAGTSLNGKGIEGGRYVELRDGDVVKFGEGEREFVVMLPPPEEKKKG